MLDMFDKSAQAENILIEATSALLAGVSNIDTKLAGQAG
jgi:hypothetical protein